MKNKHIQMSNLLLTLSLLFNVIFMFGFYFANTYIMFYVELCLLICILIRVFIKKNYLIFLFIATFVFFQMARLFLDFFGFIEDKWYRDYVGGLFDIDIQKHILLCFYLVLYAIFLSTYITLKGNRLEKKSRYFCENNVNTSVSFVFCIIFFVPAVIKNLLAIKYVQTYGYYAYNASFSPPYILSVLSGMSYVYIYIYMTITKKLNKLFIILYIVNFVTSLLIGARKDFVLYMLLLLFYIWNTKKTFSFKSIKKIIIPVLGVSLILLYVSFARMESKMSIFKFNPFLFILDQQGVSIVVPGYTKVYEDEIPNKGIGYLFPYQIRMVTNLTGDTIDSSERKKDALEGVFLAKFLSYKVLGGRYVEGEGMGGSFISEIYYCFSYIGVFIVSFLLGLFMRYCEDAKKHTLRYICILSCVFSLFYISRSGLFDIYTQITSLKFWFAIFIYILVNELFRFNLRDRNGGVLS